MAEFTTINNKLLELEGLMGDLSIDTKSPKLGLPIFSGRTDARDFPDFIKELNKVGNAMGWNEARLAQMIGICLKNEAGAIYDQLDDAIKKNWKKCVTELAHKFQRPENAHLSRLKLQSKIQGDESIAEFGNAVRNLVLRAFPSNCKLVPGTTTEIFSKQAREELEVHYFLNGLKMPLRGPLLRKQKDIASLEEAVDLAVQEETVQNAIREAQIREGKESLIAQAVADVAAEVAYLQQQQGASQWQEEQGWNTSTNFQDSFPGRTNFRGNFNNHPSVSNRNKNYNQNFTLRNWNYSPWENQEWPDQTEEEYADEYQ
jgi:hypothetical protein